MVRFFEFLRENIAFWWCKISRFLSVILRVRCQVHYMGFFLQYRSFHYRCCVQHIVLQFLRNRVYFRRQTGKIDCMNNYLNQLQKTYQNDDDFTTRQVDCGMPLTLCFLDSMCSDIKISNYVVEPLTYGEKATDFECIKKRLTTGAIVKEPANFFDVLDVISNGYTVILSEQNCIAVDTRTTLARAIIEPPTSMVMRGPREGFIEDAKTNLTLIRKRLKTADLKVTTLNVGKYTNTTVFVCYLSSIAEKKVVDEVVQQVQKINIDGVLDASYLSRYIDKNKTALFRRVGMTEKPDVAVGKMLEGRVALIVDGSPMVLTVPYLYVEDLQSPGDYYEDNTMTSLNRILRFISVLASVLLPSLYVCLQMYNYQIIPLKFLITVLNSTQAIPFSPLAEMILIIVIFDILREANLRMPSAVGISLSLVGAIVLGDAAVKAGLIGAPAVMIGALSGIGLFTMPDNTLILSLLRLVITYIAGVMGILGVILSMMVILFYLCSMQEYHTPFLAPFTPTMDNDKQDAVLNKPLVSWKKRPKSIPNKNTTRRGQ